jgi:hypothetical protein
MGWNEGQRPTEGNDGRPFADRPLLALYEPPCDSCCPIDLRDVLVASGEVPPPAGTQVSELSVACDGLTTLTGVAHPGPGKNFRGYAGSRTCPAIDQKTKRRTDLHGHSGDWGDLETQWERSVGNS